MYEVVSLTGGNFKKKVSECFYRQRAVIEVPIDEKEMVGDTSNTSAIFMKMV